MGRLLPARGGTHPVNHALTSFDNVRLPATALLGPLGREATSDDDFLRLLGRVAVGALGLGSVCVSVLEAIATIGLRYSLRRTVSNPKGGKLPIFTFRTQQVPILAATAHASVLRALANWANAYFSDPSKDPRARHGVAVIVKAIATKHALASAIEVSDRCGAQGLFEANQMSRYFVRAPSSIRSKFPNSL
jgi:acyl-CoA oxidase